MKLCKLFTVIFVILCLHGVAEAQKHEVEISVSNTNIDEWDGSIVHVGVLEKESLYKVPFDGMFTTPLLMSRAGKTWTGFVVMDKDGQRTRYKFKFTVKEKDIENDDLDISIMLSDTPMAMGDLIENYYDKAVIGLKKQ